MLTEFTRSVFLQTYFIILFSILITHYYVIFWLSRNDLNVYYSGNNRKSYHWTTEELNFYYLHKDFHFYDLKLIIILIILIIMIVYYFQFWWWRKRESNSYIRIANPSFYHWTTSPLKNYYLQPLLGSCHEYYIMMKTTIKFSLYPYGICLYNIK